MRIFWVTIPENSNQYLLKHLLMSIIGLAERLFLHRQNYRLPDAKPQHQAQKSPHHMPKRQALFPMHRFITLKKPVKHYSAANPANGSGWRIDCPYICRLWKMEAFTRLNCFSGQLRKWFLMPLHEIRSDIWPFGPIIVKNAFQFQYNPTIDVSLGLTEC
jgi:hypothetical protein